MLVGAVVVALVAAGALTAQAVQAHRERERLAALVDVPGVLRPLASPPRVLWEDMQEVLGWAADPRTTDGLVVATADRPDGDAAVARALDPATGDVVWETVLLAGTRPEVADGSASPWRSASCVLDPADDDQVVCAADDRAVLLDALAGQGLLPATQERLVVLDATDGTVVDELEAPGPPVDRMVGTGALLVLAGVEGADAQVVALHADRSVAWERTLPVTSDRPDRSATLALTPFGDGVAVLTPRAVTLLDAAGEAREVPVGRSEFPSLAPDLVVLDPPEEREGEAVTRLLRPGGDAQAPGWPVVGVDDRSVPDVVLTQDLLGALHGWDGDEELWTYGVEPGVQSVVLDGRVHLTDRRGVHTLDVRSGAVLWRSEEIVGAAPLLTDGRVLVGLAPAEGRARLAHLVALDPADGSVVWRLALPGTTQGVWTVGGLLLTQTWSGGGPEGEPGPVLVVG